MYPLLNIGNLHRIFDKLDRNGDGLVSLEELKWLLEKVGAKTSEDELESLLGQKGLDRVDFSIFYDIIVEKKGSGVIKEEAEVDKNQQQVMMLENDLVQAFEVFDVNKDGFISSEELESALCRLGLLDERCGKDCKTMIKVYDTNSDGKLDFEEFKNMMFS